LKTSQAEIYRAKAPAQLKIPAKPFDIVFLDPPYGQDLVARALARLRATGRVGAGSLIVAETGRDEPPLEVETLAERKYGAAQVTVWLEG